MYILLDACQHPGILRIIYFGKLLIDLVFTLLPIGLIVIKYEATDPPIHPKTIGINKGNDLRNLT